METLRTVDHEEVEDWITENGGEPAIDGKHLSINFNDIDKEKIDWLRFFQIFEKEQLAMIYDAETPSKEDSRPAGKKPRQELYHLIPHRLAD